MSLSKASRYFFMSHLEHKVLIQLLILSPFIKVLPGEPLFLHSNTSKSTLSHSSILIRLLEQKKEDICILLNFM